MTTELKYLAYTALLTAVLWVPYVVCQVRTNGFLKPENYKDPTVRPMPLWGQRAHRAYLNSVETFAPFAVLVIIAELEGKTGGATAFAAMAFFWIRLVYALVYWAAIPFVRTLLFTLGMACVVCLFIHVIR